MVADLAERLVHQGLGPDVCTKDISEEPLNGGDNALSVGQVVPLVRRKEVGCWCLSEPQEGKDRE